MHYDVLRSRLILATGSHVIVVDIHNWELFTTYTPANSNINQSLRSVVYHLEDQNLTAVYDSGDIKPVAFSYTDNICTELILPAFSGPI